MAAYNLEALRRKKRFIPPRVLVYGVNRIGKSTLCANAPGGILLPTEPTNIEELANEFTFPHPTSVKAVEDAIEFLLDGEHTFQTFCIDSADWLGKMITEEVCATNGWDTLDSVKFNKEGYQKVLAAWTGILRGLDLLRLERDMMIVFTAKETTRAAADAFNQPHTQSIPAISQGGSKMEEDNPVKLICDWCDVVGLIRYNIDVATTKKGDAKPNAKAVVQRGDCARKLHLEGHPSFLGGSRYNKLIDMPFENPFDWDRFLTMIRESN